MILKIDFDFQNLVNFFVILPISEYDAHRIFWLIMSKLRVNLRER